MTSTISNLVIRHNAEAGRDEFWGGDSWTTERGEADLMSAAESRRKAKEVGGRSVDAARVLGNDW